MAQSDVINSNIEHTVRDHYGRILAILAKQFGDIELAEDVLQEAIVSALEKWPMSGCPEKPVAWLMQTAKHKAIDRLRRQQVYRSKAEQLLILEQIEKEVAMEGDISEYPDQRLSLIFTCCHPALGEQVRVALTLKTLCGLSTLQVAKAFLVSESSMAQRIVRAKRKIKSAGIPYQVPPAHLIEQRLSAVLAVIYFIYNEGYYRSVGDSLISSELCEEGVHLATMMLELLPEEPEVMGLLALLYFHHARKAARISDKGELIDLEHQYRASWNSSFIETADQLLRDALAKSKPGSYQIQAAISAVHAHAARFSDTDWKQIVLLYQKLESIDSNPVIKLNLAVALSFAEEPAIGLMYLDQISNLDRLGAYHPYFTARAELLRRLGNLQESRLMYQKAIGLCDNSIERNHLLRRMRSLDCLVLPSFQEGSESTV